MIAKLSRRSEYGIRALLELALRRGQGPIQSREIAERQEIPDAYLNQILLGLRKAGIVQSVRGPSGGHLLARAPERITLAEIITVLEGLTQSDQDLASNGTEADVWIVRWLCSEIDSAVSHLLQNITLETLVLSKQARENSLTYHI